MQEWIKLAVSKAKLNVLLELELTYAIAHKSVVLMVSHPHGDTKSYVTNRLAAPAHSVTQTPTADSPTARMYSKNHDSV